MLAGVLYEGLLPLLTGLVPYQSPSSGQQSSAAAELLHSWQALMGSAAHSRIVLLEASILATRLNKPTVEKDTNSLK